MLVAAIVILAGVVVVASGRGGEMAPEYPDYPPIDLGPVSAADVALLRPPSAAWGYNMRVTDEALETIARAVTERDIKISALQQEVADLREELAQRLDSRSGAAGSGARGTSRPRRRKGRERDPARPSRSARSDEEKAPPATAPRGLNLSRSPGPPSRLSRIRSGAPGAPNRKRVTAPQPIVPGAARHEPALPQEPSGNESSDEEPSHGAPSNGVPGHAAAQYPASDEPNGQDSWEEPHQTLVWGVDHQQAKARRLQEQPPAPGTQRRAQRDPHVIRPRGSAQRGSAQRGSPSAEDRPGQDAPRQDTPTADAATMPRRAPPAPAPARPRPRTSGRTRPAPRRRPLGGSHRPLPLRRRASSSPGGAGP